MRTFWNLNREFDTQIDLAANKWFANFDSKRRQNAYLVNLESFLNWTRIAYLSETWRLKWFANFDPKAKAKWVPCGSWINFQLSPKMQRKSDRAGTWIANFWLNLFVLRAESFLSFDTKFKANYFLCKTRTIIVCKTLCCFVQID